MRLALKILAALVFCVVLAAATLPFWLGAALKPVAARAGATFARYERVDYSRFALTDLRVVRESFQFTARRLELDTPLLWLLRRAQARAALTEWQLTLRDEPTRQDLADSPVSPRELHARLQNLSTQLRAWLPHAVAERGEIERGDVRVAIARASWRDAALAIEAALPAVATLRANIRQQAESFRVEAEATSHAAKLTADWTGDTLRASGSWQEQPFQILATLGDTSWMPRTAELRAANWDLPAEHLRLEKAYARLRGSAHLHWENTSFTLAADARATPLAADAKTPPLEFQLQADGDTKAVRVHALHVRAPFADLALSSPLTLPLDGRAPDAPAQLTFRADLARQPWFPATGNLVGELRVAAATGTSRGEFQLRAEGLTSGNFSAASFAAHGDWQWPLFHLREFALSLDAESRIDGHATLDAATRTLTAARFQAALKKRWASQWLPAGVRFAQIAATVEADGPLASVRHRGELQADDVRHSQLHPLALAAQWTGHGRQLDNFTVTARNARAALRLAGALAENKLSLREISLTRDNQEHLRATAPAELTWTPTIALHGLRLEGDQRALAVDFTLGDAPSFFLSAQELSSELAADWWSGELPAARLASLRAEGRVQDSYLLTTAALDGSLQLQGTWLRARLDASADDQGLRVPRLEISDAGGLMAYASGRIPARVLVHGQPSLELGDHLPLELDASIAPNSALWSLVRDRFGVGLESAAVVANLSGTLSQPRGVVRLEVAKLLPPAREDLPAAEISQLGATLRAGRDGVQLEELAARINGHPLHARGELPMDDAAWRTLIRTPKRFYWQRARGELTAERIELPALAQTFPALPLTQGIADAHLQFAQGRITGEVRLRDGATRPLPGFGRLLGIEADLALEGRRVGVRTFSAQLGGEPVQLSGSAELTARNQLDLDLRLQAKNIPLVRRPGLLVRTDLDLRAQTPDRGPTVISGEVQLRDALLLADLATLLPGGPRGIARTPPYFSVEAEPFARWPLDVRLGGSRAVRVRTAVFNGVATPQFHLTGTLGDPRAIGQLTVDEGNVIFPFARFAVQQGAVRLTAADPTLPQLAVNATSKRLGYELRLEVGGTTASPTLAFSANPPLESADILLLVTAGQPPKDETLAPTGTQRLTRLGTYLGSGIFQNFGGDEDRLEITSGEQVSEAGRETYRVEYKLRERLSLVGEYDRYDDYNAGIRYRVYTQEGTPREDPK